MPAIEQLLKDWNTPVIDAGIVVKDPLLANEEAQIKILKDCD